MTDPRNNADDAYDAFMAMDEREWLGLIGSLLTGGILGSEEEKGFRRAIVDRGERQAT